jgi:tRNA A58 N-methylase Trm61
MNNQAIFCVTEKGIEIAKQISNNGKLFSFDVDPDAIETATEKLKEFKKSWL